MTRLLLILPLLLAACQKATPQSNATRPYEAERIRTLTHDEDLANSQKEPDWSKLAPSQSPATP